MNFIHYPEVADYAPYHELLAENCDHLIFLSSYRTYADLEHPINETSAEDEKPADEGEKPAEETEAPAEEQPAEEQPKTKKSKAAKAE